MYHVQKHLKQIIVSFSSLIYIDYFSCNNFYTMCILPIIIMTISTSYCKDLWNVNKYNTIQHFFFVTPCCLVDKRSYQSYTQESVASFIKVHDLS